MQPVMKSIPLVPRLGTNLHGLSWPSTSNPYHYKAFRLKINRVGKYPTSWKLKKLPNTGVHALSSPCRTTSLLVLKKSNGWIFHDPREKEDVLSLKMKNKTYCIHFPFFLSTFAFSFCFIPSFCFSFLFLFSYLTLLSIFSSFSLLLIGHFLTFLEK